MKKHACQKVIIYQCGRHKDNLCDYFEEDHYFTPYKRCVHADSGRCLNAEVLKLVKDEGNEK